MGTRETGRSGVTEAMQEVMDAGTTEAASRLEHRTYRTSLQEKESLKKEKGFLLTDVPIII